jgi:hypothetical protein
MKTLADFKRRLKVGVRIETINANYGSMGVRPISIVQSNSFAFKTVKTTGETVDSWCEYPKAKDFEIVDKDTAIIYWETNKGREPILTYKFID